MKPVIYNESDLKKINSSIKELHIARPLSIKATVKVLKKLKNLEVITLSNSTKKRMVKALKFFEGKKIKILIVNVKGRPLKHSFNKLKEAIEMIKDLRPLREIEKITGIPKSTLHYLKKAKKEKIKAGKISIMLK